MTTREDYRISGIAALESNNSEAAIAAATKIAALIKNPALKAKILAKINFVRSEIKKKPASRPQPEHSAASIAALRANKETRRLVAAHFFPNMAPRVSNTNVTAEEEAAAVRINEAEARAKALREQKIQPDFHVSIPISNLQDAAEQGIETQEEASLREIRQEAQTSPNPDWAGMNTRLVKLARGVRGTPLEEEYNELKQVVLEKLIDVKKPGRTVFRTPEERDTLISTRTAGFKTSEERERAMASLKTLETRIDEHTGAWSELLEPVIKQGPDFRGTELEIRYNELKEYVVDKVLAENEKAKQQKKTTVAEEEDLREQLLAINRIRKAEERLQESTPPTDESELFGHAEAPATTNANMNALFNSPYNTKLKELAKARRNPTPTRRIGEVARGLSPANLVGKLVQESASAVGAATKQPNVSVEGEGVKRLVVPGEAEEQEVSELNTGFQQLLEQQQESQGSLKQSDEEESEFTTLKPDEEDAELRAKAEEAFYRRKSAEDQSTTLADAVNMFVSNEADKAKVGLRLPAVFAVKSFKVPEATVFAKFKEAAFSTKMALVKKLLKGRTFQPFLYSDTLLETLDLEELNEQLKKK